MHISLRQMQIFQTVAQTENYTRAAEVLHMTQPAISMQIKQLEENVGLSLFERQGKKIVLTEAGKAMALYTHELLAQYQALLKTLTELKSVQKGYIRVSAATTSMYFITPLLAEFSKLHTTITVSLELTNRQALVEQLQRYEADLVIMGEPPTHLAVQAQRLIPNPLVVIAAPNHVLAQHTHISLPRLAQESFILRESGSGTRATVERFFAEQGLSLTSSMEMSSNESIKYSVMAGLGVGVVSLHSIRLELASQALVVLDVAQFPLQRYWYILTREGKWLSPAAQAFKDYMIQEAHRHV